LEQHLVYEFTAVIGIESKKSKGEASLHGLNGLQDSVTVTGKNGLAIRPTGRDIHAGQSVDKLAFGSISTVCYQIDFHKSWFLLVPGCVSLYRDRLFKQCARSGGAEPVRMRPMS